MTGYRVLTTYPASHPFRRRIEVGHHQREECLEHPGRFCQGPGPHKAPCPSCPTRTKDTGGEGS